MGGSGRGSEMSVVGGVGKAAGATEVLTRRGEARQGEDLPEDEEALVVAVALLVLLAAFAAPIPASEAPNAEHYYYYSAGTTPDRSGAGAAPVSELGPPRMSEEEALDAYAKPSLSFVPNEGQTSEEVVRYYARGAGYAPLVYT
jgi:hypothetical protein